MRGGRQRLRMLLFAAAGIVALGLGLLGYGTDALRSLELNTVDSGSRSGASASHAKT